MPDGGGGGGSTPQPPPEWDPSKAQKPPPEPHPTSQAPEPPPVPKAGSGDHGGKGDKTSVHTPALDTFAKNIGSLLPMLTTTQSTLAEVKVEPGAFYHADLIRNKINGVNGDAGVKAEYTKVLSDLKNGLASLQQAVTKMSTKYKNTEDLNKLSAKDLQSDFSEANGYFGATITDSKDSGGAPGK